MRDDANALEGERLANVRTIDDYAQVHERHRIFPAVFENRGHRRILDSSAGVGVVARRIRDLYRPAGGAPDLLCNDGSPDCRAILERAGFPSVSFDLDRDDCSPFPFGDESFDAIISLATIEHLINTDHFVRELRRLLRPDGCLYLSTPNYAGLLVMRPLLWSGRSFHNPLDPHDRYEFFAHVRYFTYRTLREYVESFGFALDTVYLGLPAESSTFLRLREKSRAKALLFRWFMRALYTFGSPRWASEPVLCFRKGAPTGPPPRKVIL
jgi:SAM-dependent methyltransferase